MPEDKTRIAIFGGGIGALSAAFDLTENDRGGERYDITIYTLGWRLGGKATVGRDDKGRAFEHGIHLWAGFYDHAFDLVKRLYRALDYPDGCWRQPFEPLNHVTLMEPPDKGKGKWLPWALGFRANSREPGIDQISSALLHPIKPMLELLAWGESEFGLHQLLDPPALDRLQKDVSAVCCEPVRIPPIAAAAAHARSWFNNPRSVSIRQSSTIRSLLELAHDSVKKGAPAKLDDRTRRAWILMDLGLAFVKGIIADDVLVKGFDSIDDKEWSDWLKKIDRKEWSNWLKKHGCQPKNLESAPMRACYDYVFGYAKGKKNVGAGTGACALLRFLLFYKGSVFYRLRMPMGDFLFAPLYELLKKRGVKFEFFHRLDELKLSKDDRVIREIVVRRQVELIDPDRGYCPLKVMSHWKSWPDQPDYGQIKDADRLKGHDLESAWTDLTVVDTRTLKLRSSVLPDDGHDPNDTFDWVILGVGLGALGPICSQLTALQSWRNMLDKVETTPTLAVQIWTTASTGELGWPDPKTVMTAFDKPGQDWSAPSLTTWEDNSDLLALEQAGTKQPEDRPKGLSYFVGLFPNSPPPPGPNPDFLQDERARAEKAADEFVQDQLLNLWPALKLDRKLILHTHVQPNINPSDRYVLSVTGSSEFRLAADGSGIRNLLLAGDWVRTSLNAGCIEAAIMAGRKAASTITGCQCPG